MEERSFTQKATREVEHITSLRKQNPRLFWFLLSAVVVVGVAWALEYFRGKSKIEAENQSLKQEVILLEAQLAPFKTVALEKYPGRLEDALKKLTKDVEYFEVALNRSEKKIRNLDLELSVVFTAPWKGEIPKKWLKFEDGSDTTAVVLKLGQSNGEVVQIDMVDMTGLKMESIGEGKTKLFYRCKAPLRSPILGSSTDEVKSIRGIEMLLMGLTRERIEDKPVLFHTLTLEFLVNGQPIWKSKLDMNWSTTLDGDRIGGLTVSGDASIPLEPVLEIQQK